MEDKSLVLQKNRSPLDVYREYLDYQLVQALTFYDNCVSLLGSFKLVERIRPKQIEFVDVGNYDRCGRWDNKLCSCQANSDLTPVDQHYTGKPSSVDVALRVPVSTFTEWLYNRCGFYRWKWSLRIMTDSSFLAEAKKRPEVYYDMFIYPVNIDYLTPATTRAALYRWLRLSCPRLDYNIALIPKDASCLPRRT